MFCTVVLQGPITREGGLSQIATEYLYKMQKEETFRYMKRDNKWML